MKIDYDKFFAKLDVFRERLLETETPYAAKSSRSSRADWIDLCRKAIDEGALKYTEMHDIMQKNFGVSTPVLIQMPDGIYAISGIDNRDGCLFFEVNPVDEKKRRG